MSRDFSVRCMVYGVWCMVYGGLVHHISHIRRELYHAVVVFGAEIVEVIIARINRSAVEMHFVVQVRTR